MGSFVNLLVYSGIIQNYEITKGIIRSSAEAVSTAKAFGQYITHQL